MDLRRLQKAAASGSNSLTELPEYIITSFLPGARPLLEKYPRLFKFLGLILAFWYFGPLARLQSLWARFSSVLVATVNVSSDEDLFGYLTAHIAERRTLRADQSLNAISNAPQEGRRRRRPHEMDVEETQGLNEDPKLKYEQGQGMQIFVHKKRVFYVTRAYGEGHTYHGNRYKRTEIVSLRCLGRSTQPIKDLIEDIYHTNKDKERSLTIIRRPYSGGYGGRLSWSRLTSKPRRALDTVILNADQKEQVIADVEEYMDEQTMAFYASHGIPYRRGYLFYGPPGVGKTSFALALAARFNLDVYNMSLLDRELTDSDLLSLLNQLPGRSLLLLEDIDTAGLNRKGKSTPSRMPAMRRRRKPEGAVAKSKLNKSLGNDDGDDETDEESSTVSRVTLSGLLNAIDGVAAPEGHVMIMTTNNPEKLDDALVRAGRISVRVGFNKASKKQAEEIFLRMYVDQPSSKEDPTAAEEKTTAISNQETSPMRDFARQFAANIPDHEFSPADLQDYLLMHKKDAAAAVREIKGWMEEQYEERRRKEDEKDVEREMKREAKKEERRRFRDEIKKAVNADDTDDENENEQDDRKGADKGSDEEKFEEVRQSDEQIVKQDGEAAAS